MATTKSYTSTADLQNYLIENIAPNYFDFNQVNNYRAGIFGYVNEVISTITMDTHNAINMARREFYPVSAQNPKSFYKMAALQQVGLPMVTPAKCKAVLLLDRDEVINNSTYKDGIYTCVIDDSVQIMADNIPFCLLYPIVIISNETNGSWTHTIHYDKSNSNDIDNSTSNYYITNRTVNQEGKKWLLLSVQLYQCSKEIQSELVTTDNSIESVSLIFSFEGDLAGFEVFYIQDPEEATPVQLIKLMEGQSMVESPFCYYRLLNSNQIEISFPKNIYFTPDLNSEVQIEIYTSLGKSGEFPEFDGDLACTMDSEDYPYNNNMTMLGKTNGSSTGAKDIPTTEEYQEIVKAAYTTNNTITTSNDLQILFNENSTDAMRIVFRKKRADAFIRTYGAYVLLKDDNGNVVPTNTLTVTLNLSDFDSYNEATTKAVIKPGTLFEYDPSSYGLTLYTGMKTTDLKLSDDLSIYDESFDRFLYTNPFLIICTLDPNLVGYYFNSMNESHSVEYTYMNDASIVQFIGSNFMIERDAIAGENFYKFSMRISPTSELTSEDIISIPTTEEEDYYIRAKKNGTVIGQRYDVDTGTVVADIRYVNGDEETIQLGSFVSKVDSTEESETTEEDYIYHTGYTLNVDVYGTFIEGDIIATKKVTDKGKIRVAMDMEGTLYENGFYIPMVIEEYDESTNIYTLCGYISTEDTITNDGTILIEHGINEVDGLENDNISVPYSGIQFLVSVFYRYDDTNISHKYSTYDYFRKHTLTNTYMEDTEDGIALIQHIDFIRSTLTFNEVTASAASEDEISAASLEDEVNMTIKEIPLTKANWIKDGSNFTYLIDEINQAYSTLQVMYYNLENNFGFDMKFYNTYGKSKFFKAGIRSTWSPLSQVNCTFRFGVYLSAITSQETFLEKFRNYVKEKIESINSTDVQQSIYIMSLINSIQSNFSEIGYIEYYGFNDFKEDTQKIEPVSTSEMSTELLTNYIPEFINIGTHVENGENVLNIEVTFLNSTEEE